MIILNANLYELTAWLLVWDGSGLRCYLANFFFREETVGVEEVALTPIGTRALTFIPRFPPDCNHRILFDFGHPISLCIHVMASILSIGLGVGVAAFLVCDAVTPRAEPD